MSSSKRAVELLKVMTLALRRLLCRFSAFEGAETSVYEAALRVKDSCCCEWIRKAGSNLEYWQESAQHVSHVLRAELPQALSLMFSDFLASSMPWFSVENSCCPAFTKGGCGTCL